MLTPNPADIKNQKYDVQAFIFKCLIIISEVYISNNINYLQRYKLISLLVE